MEERKNPWKFIADPGRSDILSEYVDCSDMDSAYVRIVHKQHSNGMISDYFQISGHIPGRQRYFKSFEVYGEEELENIKENLPGIPEHESSEL